MTDSWKVCPLSSVTVKVGSGATPKGGEAAYKQSGIPLIRSMNVVFFGFKREGIAYLSDEQAVALKNVEVKPNDILLNITGASIGRVTLAPADMAGARVNQHVCIIRPSDALEPRFLRAFLSSPSIQGLIASDNYGVTRQALTKQQILEFEIPVPPVEEQKRIADKLDKVLARVDAARERLDRIPEIIKRFRQSVLAAATSGRLTEEWRGENSTDIGGMARTENTELPGWRWTNFEELKSPERHSLAIGPFGSNLKVPDYRDEGVPLVFVREIRARVFGGRSTKYVTPEKAIELSAHSVDGGDLLITKMGDPPGDTAIYPVNSPRAVITADCIKLRVNPEVARVEFVAYAIESPDVRDRMKEITAGVAQQKISLSRLRDFSLLLPPIQEQVEIVRRVNDLFFFADQLEKKYQVVCQRLEKITPAVLAKAFRGEILHASC